MIRIGKLKVGMFCGERLFSLKSWRRYGLFNRVPAGGFSIGPVLFWRSW